MRISRLASQRVVIGSALMLVLAAGGCTKYDGVSDYDRVQMEQQKGVDAIIAQGGKAERKNRGLGDAWAVNLEGKTITDETIVALKQADKISELHLSRSTVTDDQIAAMREQKIFNSLIGLDLSHTAVTDAALDKLSDTQFLGQLNVTGTKVTTAGVARFKRARQDNPQVPPITKNTKVIGP